MSCILQIIVIFIFKCFYEKSYFIRKIVVVLKYLENILHVNENQFGDHFLIY